MDVRMPDGTIITNVPEGTTQEDLMGRLQEPQTPKSGYPVEPWAFGQSMAKKPTPEEVRSAASIPRSILGDAVMGPAQAVAGLADLGNAAALKFGIPGANTARMSDTVSAFRNKLADRPGIAPGPLTGFVQGLVTAPFSSSKFIPSALQGAGLGAGLASPDESQLQQGLTSGIISGSLAMASGLISNAPRIQNKGLPSARDKLMDTARREGIDMTYGTQTGSKMAKEIESRAERSVLLGFGESNIAKSTREQIDDQLARAVWRRAGQNDMTEFTSEAFNSAAKNIGEKLSAPFANKSIPFKSPALDMTIYHAAGMADDHPEYLIKAAIALDRQVNKGTITSSELNVLNNDLRFWMNKAYDDGNKTAGDAIREMMRAVRGQAIAQIPSQTGKEAYKRALTEWANLKVIEDAFVKSSDSARGNLDFTKLKSAIERNMPGGYVSGRADLTDLADLGMAMKPGSALPEGVKVFTADAPIYYSLNNPLSRYLRMNNPLNKEPTAAGLKALGIGVTTQP